MEIYCSYCHKKLNIQCNTCNVDLTSYCNNSDDRELTKSTDEEIKKLKDAKCYNDYLLD